MTHTKGIADDMNRLCTGDPDVCGICGQPGAEKYAKWIYGFPYLYGEQVPTACRVHVLCEIKEQRRARRAALQPPRKKYIRSKRRDTCKRKK